MANGLGQPTPMKGDAPGKANKGVVMGKIKGKKAGKAKGGKQGGTLKQGNGITSKIQKTAW